MRNLPKNPYAYLFSATFALLTITNLPAKATSSECVINNVADFDNVWNGGLAN